MFRHRMPEGEDAALAQEAYAEVLLNQYEADDKVVLQAAFNCDELDAAIIALFRSPQDVAIEKAQELRDAITSRLRANAEARAKLDWQAEWQRARDEIRLGEEGL